jgi:hypothetical protein
MPPTYVNALRNDVTWLGHVRKRSPGTATDVHAAHPYEFTPIAGSVDKLVVAHNGYIRGTVVREDDVANTDSYRAARVFAEMVTANSGVIDKALIETWISGFGYGSEWSLLIAWRGRTYIVRGQRTIYATELGDEGEGVMFSTSEAVLLYVRGLIRMIDPKTKFPAVRLILQHHLITIEENGLMSMEPYTYKAPEAPPAVPYLWFSDAVGKIKTLLG